MTLELHHHILNNIYLIGYYIIATAFINNVNMNINEYRIYISKYFI